MTRGKLIYITNDRGDSLCSPEFNGDMGSDMVCGQLAIERLKNCKDVDSFKDIVIKFLKEYGYEEDYSEEEMKEERFLREINIVARNFAQPEYFDWWFSDYLYLLNNTGSSIETRDYHENKIQINPGLTVLCFGSIDEEAMKELENK